MLVSALHWACGLAAARLPLGPPNHKGASVLPMLQRRQVLRTSLVAAGAALATAGVVTRPVAAAGLTPADPVIDLTFAPWWPTWNQTGRRLLAQATAEFATRPGRRGLRLHAVPGPEAGGQGTDSTISAMLAGEGPDVVTDTALAWPAYVSANLFENLTPYLRRDNVSTSIWAPQHVRVLSTGQGQMALPAYDGAQIYTYRQDILDDLGLRYPSPDWTYQDAEKLWRQCAGTIRGTHTHRWGAAINWWPSIWQPGNCILHGFGGALMDNSHTRCLLDDPASIAAGEWVMPLIWDKVASIDIVEHELASLSQGTVVFMLSGGWNVINDVLQNGTKFKWDYIPVPRYPQGRAAYQNDDFFGMNALSKHKDAVWEVMKWLTVEDYWQEFMARVWLLGPNRLDLWEKWEYWVQQAAPLLRTKAIHWYRDAIEGGYTYPHEFFRYQALQADILTNDVMGKLSQHQLDVVGAFHQLTRQINALEVAGRGEEAAQLVEMKTVAQYVAKAKASAFPVTYPAPPRSRPAAGLPPSDASPLVKVLPGGAIDMLAQGHAGITEFAGPGRMDNCTFAGSTFTLSRGSFRCRLVSVSLPKGGQIAGGAKVGLMARSSLSNAAADVAVFFAADHGIHALVRPIDGDLMSEEMASSASATTGLMGLQTVQVAATPPAGGNWLVRPIWLRLDLNGNVWTPYTSLDGKNWSIAGIPRLLAEFVGAWVGVFATSHCDFSVPHQYIRAVFDHVSGFAPTTAVQIGQF